MSFKENDIINCKNYLRPLESFTSVQLQGLKVSQRVGFSKLRSFFFETVNFFWGVFIDQLVNSKK